MLLLKQRLAIRAFLRNYLPWAAAAFFLFTKQLMLFVKRDQPIITGRPSWYEPGRDHLEGQQVRVQIPATLLSLHWLCDLW